MNVCVCLRMYVVYDRTEIVSRSVIEFPNNFLCDFLLACVPQLQKLNVMMLNACRKYEFTTTESHAHRISADIVRMWLCGYKLHQNTSLCHVRVFVFVDEANQPWSCHDMQIIVMT